MQIYFGGAIMKRENESIQDIGGALRKKRKEIHGEGERIKREIGHSAKTIYVRWSSFT